MQNIAKCRNIIDFARHSPFSGKTGQELFRKLNMNPGRRIQVNPGGDIKEIGALSTIVPVFFFGKKEAISDHGLDGKEIGSGADLLRSRDGSGVNASKIDLHGDFFRGRIGDRGVGTVT